MKRTYLDYAASTPVDPRVLKAMKPYFTEKFGNPHALHSFGQEASRAVFSARRRIAASIGADYKEIIFTGSATEANNLAIRGIVKSFRRQASGLKRPRIITTAIEHESVLETCRDLEREGVEVIYVPVDKDGVVNTKKIKAALNERTVLVSVMHANNEVGTIQPISEISKIIADFRSVKLHESSIRRQGSGVRGQGVGASGMIHDACSVMPLFHTDAVQSFQYLDCDVNQLGVDLMTISAHKIYGPKGIGALYVRSDRDDKRSDRAIRSSIVEPIITGSGQEFGLRSGTDNVPYIAGFAKAVEIAGKMRNSENKRIKKLRDYFWSKLKKINPRGLELNGSMENRLPNNLSIHFPGQKAHDLQMRLDLAGVAVSPGAACSTRVSKASYVLEEMGFSVARTSGSLRFSFGRQTNKADMDFAIDKISSSML